MDRIGDTFRWKGENVSTSEVEIAISSLPGVTHAIVYGVSVPGQDGRAGMAAISPKDGVDLKALHAHMAMHLPAYARPIFVRFQAEAETTGTMKYRKVDLVKDGFDPMNTSDGLFVTDNDAGTYRPITPDVHRDIVSGKIRL